VKIAAIPPNHPLPKIDRDTPFDRCPYCGGLLYAVYRDRDEGKLLAFAEFLDETEKSKLEFEWYYVCHNLALNSKDPLFCRYVYVPGEEERVIEMIVSDWLEDTEDKMFED